MSLDDKKKDYIDHAQHIRAEITKMLERTNDSDLKKTMSDREGSWNVLEVAKHLYTSEDGMVKLMKIIKDHNDPNTLPGVPEDFDRDRYNKRQVQKIQELTKDDIMKKLAESRQSYLSFVESLSEGDLEKKGRHASLNIYTIEEIVKIIPRHEEEHLTKIRNVLTEK